MAFLRSPTRLHLPLAVLLAVQNLKQSIQGSGTLLSRQSKGYAFKLGHLRASDTGALKKKLLKRYAVVWCICAKHMFSNHQKCHFSQHPPTPSKPPPVSLALKGILKTPPYFHIYRLIAWTSGPRCNTQLQISFFKPKDSFMYPMSYTCFTYCVHPRKLQRSAGTYFP